MDNDLDSPFCNTVLCFDFVAQKLAFQLFKQD